MPQPTEPFDLTVQLLWAEPPLDTVTQPLQSRVLRSHLICDIGIKGFYFDAEVITVCGN